MKRSSCFLLFFFLLSPLFLQAQIYSKSIDSLWNNVEDLMSQALPKSALAEVDKIQEMSRKENNWVSYIDCILHKGEIWKTYEEKPILSMMALLEKEIAITPSPAKEVLYSILGQTLSEYYMTKRFFYHDQLPAVDINPKDIETWDFTYLLTKIKEIYFLSLGTQNKETISLLQKTGLKVYENILQTEEKNNIYRPSLYDLLSYRALNTFIDLQNSQNKSFDTEIEEIYANLDSFHLKDSLPLAWVDMILNKAAYLRSQNKMSDENYLRLLDEWREKYADFSVCGDILFNIADYWYRKGSNYQALDTTTLQSRFDKKKAYAYAMDAIQKYPQSMGAKNSNVLIAQITNTVFSLETKSFTLPEKPMLASIGCQNMDSLFIRFYKLSDSEMWAYQENLEKEEWRNKFQGTLPFQDRAYKLPETGDYQTHRVEVNLGILPIGSYLCKISSKSDFSLENSSAQVIQVSTLSCIVATENGEKAKGFVLNRESGKGVIGVAIQLYTSEFDYKNRKNTFTKASEYLSKSDGSFLITASDKAKTYNLVLNYKGQTLWLDENIWLRKNQEAEADVQKKVYWFTDRAIYRPGDIVQAKGILTQYLNDSLSILPSTKVISTLYSPKNQEIDKIETTTNGFGSFHLSFQIPLQGIKGRMSIRALSSRVYFEVEEYKRPTFEVVFDTNSPNYILGDSINISGYALSYNGQELANAKYTYRVYRQRAYPFFRYMPSYYPRVNDKTLVGAGENVCNAAGQFSIGFSSLVNSSLITPNNNYQSLFQFLIEVDVCDMNGEIQRGVHSMLLSNTALFTNAAIPKEWVNVKSMKVNIESSNVSGQSVPVKGRLKIYKIEERSTNPTYPKQWNEADQFIYSEEKFKQLFPFEAYENNLQKEEKEIRIAVEELHFEAGDSTVFIANCEKWKQGRYHYELEVNDAQGNKASNEGDFTFMKTDGKKDFYPSFFEFVNLTPKVSIGENVSILLSSAQTDLWVYYEIQDRENNREGYWTKISKEQKIIQIPLLKNSKGPQVLSVLWVKNNYLYISESNIEVNEPNPNLEIYLTTFRNKMEVGSKETWEIKVKNIDSTFQNADSKEILASMYDAALDAFVPHSWHFDKPFLSNPYPIWSSAKYIPNFQSIRFYPNTYSSFINYNAFEDRTYSSLRWEGFNTMGGEMPLMMSAKRSTAANTQTYNAPLVGLLEVSEALSSDSESSTQWDENIPLPLKTEIRKDFKETVFFYPSLLSDTNGNVRFSFQAPQGLSKWKFQCFAHSKSLQTALFSKEVITEKELMIFPKVPRFVRMGDSLVITCKTQTLSPNNTKGNIRFEVFSLESGETLLWIEGNNIQDLSFDTNNNALNTWKIGIPYGFDAIGYRFIAQYGNFSDGEEGLLPVYPRELKLTESLNLFINANEKKIFDTKELFKNKSKTSFEYALCLEFCQNPIWYAIKALPYLSANSTTADGVASSLFMQNMGRAILENNPTIVDNIRYQQAQDKQKDDLNKNLNLQQISIENTPWTNNDFGNVDLHKLLLLLDNNTFERDQKALYLQLENFQLPNGAFSWIKFGNESKYITQEIVFFNSLLMNLQNTPDMSLDNSIFQKALNYLDIQYNSEYDKIIKYDSTGKKMYLNTALVNYLYSKATVDNHQNLLKQNKVYAFFHSQATLYWTKQNLHSQAILALYFHKIGAVKDAEALLKSIAERALVSEEAGMYFRASDYNGNIYTGIETQALLIVAFETISKDTTRVNLLKQWLIAQKRTQNWGNEKATSLAVYALLASENLNAQSQETENISIQMGNVRMNTAEIQAKDTEAGSGYFQKTWTGKDIPAKFDKVILEKKGGKGISFGALYRQYSEDADKINASKGGLEIRKTYFVSIPTSDGKEKWELIKPNQTLRIGDRVQVQLEISSDRNLEFVHLVNMRAAALEPLAFESGYTSENGLVYYKSIEDAVIHYFFEQIGKGRYSISYEVKVDQAGVFSDGTASIQCLYAPEFTGHSAGGVFRVK